MDRREVELQLNFIKSSSMSLRLDASRVIHAADALQLGERLFQKRLADLAKVDGWTDAALMIAEAAVPGPLYLTVKTGHKTNERCSAQIQGDEPVHVATLAQAILGAVLQHRLKLHDQDAS
jgi:hypothetical protein